MTSRARLYIVSSLNIDSTLISPLNDHARPLAPPHPLVLRMDPHLHSFCMGRHTACDAHHLACPRAAQVRQHGRVNRVHIRHWGRHPQTPFYCWLLHHSKRVRHHPRGGTVVETRGEVPIQNFTVAGRTVLTFAWVQTSA